MSVVPVFSLTVSLHRCFAAGEVADVSSIAFYDLKPKFIKEIVGETLAVSRPAARGGNDRGKPCHYIVLQMYSVRS